MIELGRSSVLTTIKEYVLMTVGMFCYAFGWIGCILPAQCVGGGASGLSLLIYYATGGTITIGVMVFIINAILLIIAGFIVGWKFGIKTIFCVCMLSFAMSTMQALFTQPDGTIIIDASRLRFPFVLRGWRKGDWMIPLGMRGKKKLSDLFTDLKYGHQEKSAAVVVVDCKGNHAEKQHVAGVLPIRPDDSYKVTGQTKEIIRITITDNL